MAEATFPRLVARPGLGERLIDALLSGRGIWPAVPAIVVLTVVAVIPFIILLSLGFSDFVVSRGEIVSQTFSLDHLYNALSDPSVLDHFSALADPCTLDHGSLPDLRLPGRLPFSRGRTLDEAADTCPDHCASPDQRNSAHLRLARDARRARRGELDAHGNGVDRPADQDHEHALGRAYRHGANPPAQS